MADIKRTLRRVALVAALNGWSMVIFGLLCVVGTLALIVLYGAYQLASFDAESVMKSVSSALDQQSLQEMGLDEVVTKELVRKVYYTLYISVIVTGILYQGGLCLYYWRKTRKLRS